PRGPGGSPSRPRSGSGARALGRWPRAWRRRTGPRGRARRGPVWRPPRRRVAQPRYHAVRASADGSIPRHRTSRAGRARRRARCRESPAKSLSHKPPHDQHGGELDEREVVLRSLLPPDEQLTKAVEPRVGALDATRGVYYEIAAGSRIAQSEEGSRSRLLHSVRGLTDHIVDTPGLRQHRDVTSREFRHLRIHTFGEEALEIGLHSSVFSADDVIGWFLLPSSTRNGLREQVRQRPHLGGPYEFLFRFGQVARKFRNSRRTKVQAPVRDLDMLEDGGLRKFRLVGLRRVTVLRRQSADINERLDAIIHARSGDDGAAIGMADEHDGTVGPTERCPHCGSVVGDSVQMVLR